MQVRREDSDRRATTTRFAGPGGSRIAAALPSFPCVSCRSPAVFRHHHRISMGVFATPNGSTYVTSNGPDALSPKSDERTLKGGQHNPSRDFTGDEDNGGADL